MDARALIGQAEPTAALAEALRRGSPVVVVGEVGSGKTSVIRAAAAQAGRRLHEGGGFATLSWLPYLALRRAVPIGDVTEPAWVATEVRAAVGDGVLFIDDHHWADDSTRAVVDLLMGQIAVAVAIRAGEPGAAEAVVRFRERGGVVVRLEGLERAMALALARQLMPSASEAARRGVVEAAGGNPLVLEMLAAHGDIPSWLKRALLRQVECLTAAERGALERLAAAGRSLPAGEIGPACSALSEAGLLEWRGAGLAIRHRLIAEALRPEGSKAVPSGPPAEPRATGQDPGVQEVDALIAAGQLRAAVERAETLLSRPAVGGVRPRVLAGRGLALGLLGLFDEAEQALSAAAASAVPYAEPSVAVLQAQAEASLWGGRPGRALDQAHAALDAAATDEARVSAAVAASWAEVELGRIPSSLDVAVPPNLAGPWQEVRALEALQAGDAAAAAASFEAARTWWDGRNVPRQLRCRWALAEARRRAGDPDAAASLRATLEAAEEIGFEPLAARIRRSLRLAGDRPAGPRGLRTRGDILTARERQVMQLVERGRTNSEIARRMGLGRPTVARMLSNAMTKLGAQSRAQAVVLAAEGQRRFAGAELR